MKRFIHQLQSDLIFGFTSQWRRYLTAVVIMAIIGGIAVGNITTGIENQREYSSNKEEIVISNASFGDVFCGFFGGGEPFNPSSMTKWAMPITLLLVCSLVFYLTLDYPYRDLAGMGKQLIVTAGSRWGWWLSKCVWVIASVSVFYALLLGVVAASCGLMGGVWKAELWYVPAVSLELRVSDLIKPESARTFIMSDDSSYDAAIDLSDGKTGTDYDPFASFVSMDDMEPMRWSIARCIPLIYLMLVVLCLMQLVASLLVGPLPAFGISISTILISSWAVHPALLGNYLMVTRTTEVSITGVDVSVGLALAAVLIIAFVVGGGFVFSRMDILGGERWAS